jgi:hypothetical protein
MAKKAPKTPEEMASGKEIEKQFFDIWTGRLNLSSAFGLAVAGGVTAGVAVSWPVALPIAGGVAAGMGALWAGTKVVNFIHTHKR